MSTVAQVPTIQSNLEHATTPDRWPALDGLRGLMTVGVLLAHVHYSWLPGSILFMDSFFMMSSFFITRLLLKDWRRNGRLRLGNFYLRRAKRLFPALVLMVAFVWAVDSTVRPPGEPAYLHIWGALFYFGNWLRAFGIPHNPLLGHTWSLSIEEQFYALWPLLFWAGLVFSGRCHIKSESSSDGPEVNTRFWLVALLGVAALTVVWRAHLALSGAPYWRLYNGTDMRLDSLSIGAALAISFRSAFAQKLGRILCAPWLVWVMLIVMMAAVTTVDVRWMNWYIWQEPLCVLLSAGLLIALLQTPHRWGLKFLFQNRVSLYLGSICYGLYLWHYPLIELSREMLHWSPAKVLLICGPATVILASLSYFLVELPALGGRKGSAR
jgi:peptidoglycan/LPS O-acetylase OafA/YrhL